MIGKTGYGWKKVVKVIVDKKKIKFTWQQIVSEGEPSQETTHTLIYLNNPLSVLQIAWFRDYVFQ